MARLGSRDTSSTDQHLLRKGRFGPRVRRSVAHLQRQWSRTAQEQRNGAGRAPAIFAFISVLDLPGGQCNGKDQQTGEREKRQAFWVLVDWVTPPPSFLPRSAAFLPSSDPRSAAFLPPPIPSFVAPPRLPPWLSAPSASERRRGPPRRGQACARGSKYPTRKFQRGEIAPIRPTGRN